MIVMLTAESEGGQRKSHPYWVADSYGPMKVTALSEKRISLEASDSKLTPNYKKQGLLTSPLERPVVGRRRATNPQGVAAQEVARDVAPPSELDSPHVIVRKLALSHTSKPFLPMREITQLHYSSWPDFGAPASPIDVLTLVEQCNAVIRYYNHGSPGHKASAPAAKNERPIIVHCSAGCGRTGTFCTIDSVIDMLKRQREAQRTSTQETDDSDMEMDEEDWVEKDDTDLIAKTVEDFRHQRLSMVQTLKQYVLCYETVLEWMVKEMPEKFKRERALRRSYQG